MILDNWRYKDSIRQFNIHSRKDRKETLKNVDFDLLIIGGGSTGSGIALDAASRGLKVALVEAKDFASETSSKSTKLLHGGIRYLDKAISTLSFGQLKLVIEALKERANIIKIAPYLTSSIKIMIPLYKKYLILYYWILLKLYDLLSGSKSLGSSKFINAQETSINFGGLKKSNLAGSITYYDGRMDDARLNVMIIVTASFYSATVMNYMKLDRFEIKCGKVVSAICIDQLSGEKIEIKSKVFINATGPFADSVKEDKSDKSVMMIHSSGTHIVLEPKYGPLEMGLVDRNTVDNRILFIIPWKDKVVVGATDIKINFNKPIKPTQSDIDFLKNEVEKYYCKKIDNNDILSVWTGVRPLIKDNIAQPTEQIIRKYKLLDKKTNLIIITGGKWTTYRIMAEKTVDLAIKNYNLEPKYSCVTKDLQILGSKTYSKDLFYKIATDLEISIEYAKHLLNLYGDRAFNIKKYLKEHENQLSQKYLFKDAEVFYVIENEYAITVGDIVNNRFRLGYYDVKEAFIVGKKILILLKTYYNWNKNRLKNEKRKFVKELKELGFGLL
ncbi:glycerol 3 P DHase A [Nucleospora cyclopteri]